MPAFRRPQPRLHVQYVLWSMLAALLMYTGAAPAQSGAASQERAFDIPAGPLAQALNRFAEQSGLLLIYPAELTARQHSPGLQGNYLPLEALRQLLEGTGIEARETADGTLRLRTVSNTLSTILTANETVGKPDKAVLPQITVQSTPIDDEYSQPRAVSRVTRADIDRAGARHASEILQATPGVFTVTNEQIPSVTVEIRGLKDFGRVNMNIDGMRQNYQRSGHQQRNGEMFFDPELLADVEITKGPNSSGGGAGATGGVATFRTLTADDVLRADESFGGHLRLRSGIGEWANGQQLLGSAAVAARSDGGADVILTYSRQNSGFYEPGQRGEALLNDSYAVPATIVNGTSQDMESILFKAGWNFTDWQRLQFTYLGTDASYSESADLNSSQAFTAWSCSRPGNETLPVCQDFEYDPTDVYPLAGVNEIVNANYAVDYRYGGKSPLLDLAFKSYYVTTRNDYASLLQDVQSHTRTNTVGGLASNNAFFSLTDRLELNWLFGVEAFRDHTEPQTNSTTLSGDDIASANGTTPEGNRLLASVFSSLTLRYAGWLELNPGLRYDYYRLWGTTLYTTPGTNDEFLIDVDHSEGKSLPTLGIAVTPLRHLQIFANAGLGWRPPAITETLISGAIPGHPIPANNYPNWTLEPESTRSWEAGFNVRTDRFGLKLVHFESESENYIFLQNSIGTPGASQPSLFNSMFANSLDTIVFRGEELSLDYDAGAWYGGLSLTRMERIGRLITRHYPAGGAPDDPHWDTALLQATLYYPIPPEYSGALDVGVRLFSRSLQLGTQIRHTSKSGDHWASTIEQGIRTAAATVIDLYADWRIGTSLRAGFHLKNAADRQYIQANGDAVVRTYAPGRTLTASLEWRF